MAERIGLSAVFETEAFSNGLSVYLRGNAQAEAVTNRTASALNSAGAGISAGFGAAMGIVAVQAIEGFVSSAGNAIASALEITSAFEQLEFGIRALGAIQDLIADKTDSFSQGFIDNAEAAKGWILLMQDIAIPSIFTTQQIAEGQRMLQVYGFTAEAAFEVNKALVEFATAGNLSVATMKRISYATGQLLTDNRLLQKDVKQFADAGIPIIAVIAKALGKTFQQVQKDMSDGLLTANVVMPILMDFFKNFEGVTAESQKTLRGMFSALVDVKEIATKNFFGALLEPVVPLLQSITRLFTDEKFTAGAQALGEFLGPKFAQAVGAGVKAIMAFMTAITSLSPQTVQFIAILAGGIVVLTAFAAAAGLISLAIGVLVTPFTLAVAAISAFVAAYTTNFANVQNITQNVVSFIGNAINGIIDFFGRFASAIGRELSITASSLADFLDTVASWGENIISTLAEGITSAVSLVVDAMSVIASAISYLLAPGSPPRLLPKLDQWGKEAADVYLQGWTQADFGALDEIGNFIEQALKLDFGDKEKGMPTFQWVAQAKQAVAQAIDEIRNFGNVTESTLNQIRKTTGSTSDEVLGYLERYQALALVTNQVEDAQRRLNEVTEKYDKLIRPLQNQLDKFAEAKQRAGEEREVKGLERLLQRAGVSDFRKAEATARIQEILTRQKIAGLEAEKDAQTDKIQEELDASTKAQEIAQKELDLFNQRLQIQNQYNSAIESGMQAIQRAAEKAAKAAKEGLTVLEKQLKFIQLQQEEMVDLVKEAKARKVLEDETATAAQKMTAQLELQEIATRRQLRDIEAAKLGGTLENLRQIQIVAADLEKPAKGKGKLDAIASSFEVFSNADPEGRLAKFREQVDGIYKSIEELGISIETTARKMNDSLPSFLQFMNPPGVEGPGPLWGNLLTVLQGFAAYKFTAVTAGLLGLGPAGAAAAIGIGLFTAAYQGDWFGMQEKTRIAVDFIKSKIQELSQSELYTTVITRLGELKKAIDDLLLPDRAIPSEDLMGGMTPGKGEPKIKNFLVDMFEQATSEENIIKIKGMIQTGLGKALNLDMAELFKIANFGTRFGGEFLIAIIQGTDDAIAAYLKWFIGTAMPEMIKGTGKALGGMAVTAFKYLFTPEGSAELEQSIIDWFNTIFVEGGGVMGAVVEAGKKIGKGILDGITEFWNAFGVIDAGIEFGKWIGDMGKWWVIGMGFSEKAARMLGDPIGRGILMGLVATLLPTPQHVWDSFDKFVRGIGENVKLINAWIEAGAKLAWALIKSIVDVVVVHGTVEIAKALLEAVTGISIGPDEQGTTEGQSVGQSIGDGIIAGIKAVTPDFGITEALNNVYTTAQDWLLAKSPSRRFEEGVGIPIAQGITKGAETLNLSTLQTIIEGALKKAVESMASTLVQTTTDTAIKIVAAQTQLRTDLGVILVGMYADQIAWQSSMTTSLTAWTSLIYMLFNTLYISLQTDTGIFVGQMGFHYGVLQSGIENTVRTMSSNVSIMFSNLHTSVNTELGNMIETVKTKLEEMLEMIQVNFVDKGEELGKDFADGIVDGMLSKLEEIADAARKLVNEAVSAAQTELETGSPSKRSDREVGEPFGMGIAQGVLSTINPVINSVSRMMDSMLSSVQSRQSPVYPGNTSNVSSVRNYNLNVQSAEQSRGIVYDFGIMELMTS